jgi:DNA-binding XRE family transcriptional regulator
MAASTPHLSDLTRRFRAARAWAGIELKDAAKELHTSESTLGRVEKGVYPVKPSWIAWARLEWKVPPWLLLGDAADQGDQDDAARRLADFSQRELDRDEREHPEEPGAGEGIQ